MAGKYVFIGGSSADDVTYLPPFTGGTAEALSSKLSEFISVKDFGAVGDGVTDDAAALTLAFTQTGRAIYIPAGTYLYNSALPAPTCSAIFGEGDLVSILKPGTGLTRGLSIGGGNYPSFLGGFQVLGTLATTATLLFLGEAGSCRTLVQQLRLKGASGAGGVGLRLADAVKTLIQNIVCEHNENGMVSHGITGDFPTTTLIEASSFNDNSNYGAKIIGANLVSFQGCNFDSNTLEGVIADSSGTTVIDNLRLIGCWFEGNNGNTNTKYHVVLGTNSGVGLIRAYMTGCQFDTNTGGTRARVVDCNGSEVAYAEIIFPNPGSQYANSINLRNSAVAYVLTPPSLNYQTVVVEASSAHDYGPMGRSFAWTPTIANATWSVGPTISLAQYKAVGCWADIEFTITGTTTNTPTSVTLTMPSGLTIKNSTFSSARITVNSVLQGGSVACNQPDNLIYIGKLDGSAMAAGPMTLNGSIRVELA